MPPVCMPKRLTPVFQATVASAVQHTAATSNWITVSDDGCRFG